MTQKAVFSLIGLLLLTIASCRDNSFNGGPEVQIPDFNFPRSTVFKDSLSKYDLFQGKSSELKPSEGVEILELSSVLFTDYAHKQRLVKVPAGTQIQRHSDDSLDFPDGTILTKTFFYYHDERDTSLGKRIIETRLLIKESDTWSAATYLWNEQQTEAILEQKGFETQVSWTGPNGNSFSTLYQVPTENQCMTCHQSNSAMTPLGPTLLNLNRDITKNGNPINQISHLQSIGILTDFPVDQVPHMVDYKDLSVPLDERGRAYLAMNCAHCHNSTAWDTPAERDFDFRYEVSLQESGIPFGKDKIIRNLVNQEMPFIGTTMLDEKGVALLIEYLENL